jgi:hypothetical protein
VQPRRAARLALALAVGAVAACHSGSRAAATELPAPVAGEARAPAGTDARAPVGTDARAPFGTDARAPVGTDSLKGIVRVVGIDALPVVTLVPDDASRSVTLDGPPSLRRVAGLRIAVVGERSGARLAVRRFTVLAANGVPATDGVLAADGDALVLVTSDGTRHRLVNPPPLLRSSVGHRAWVSGALDRAPVAYGIIE